MRPIRFVLAVASLFAASLGTARADIVTQWNYSISSSWTAATGAAGVGTSTLQWGTSTGSGQSSLELFSPTGSSNPITTYIGGGAAPTAYWADGGSVTHNNKPITGSTLTAATLTATLSLQAITPSYPGPGAMSPLDINIAFAETPNSGTCAVSTSPTPCNDIFVLLSGLPNQNFVFEGETYFLNLFPSSAGSFSVLEASACLAAGQAAGCIGFTTVEGQATNVPFSFTISTQALKLPEPGALSLVGLAVLGAAAAGRRRRG
ncbi:THxN family PEP-CTERM protein [Roseateles sp. NT4]|uniref:THxN family PEP-CTERM protein n=1 Tax=Roseateles sp. NT4 TaxID=3453715 RepID=UPI003EECF5B5